MQYQEAEGLSTDTSNCVQHYVDNAIEVNVHASPNEEEDIDHVQLNGEANKVQEIHVKVDILLIPT